MTDPFELVVYPFLFMALYFQVFLLLTFFDREAKKRRGDTVLNTFPFVSIIVPCFNEEGSISGSIDSILKLDYPPNAYELIIVDDGSTDSTAQVLERYRNNPRITIIRKANGGKHTALNAGIEIARGEYIACLDADSFVSKESLRESIAHFDDERIAAVTASMSIHKPKIILERMQQAEYLLGIILRHILSTVNGLYVTPGPFTVYRKSVFQELGSFTSAHNTEDMEIALRIQRAGLIIQNAPRARVYTNAPGTLRALVKQRIRWTTGFIRNAYDYRDLFFNPKYGVLGLLVLPLGVLSIVSGIGLFFLTLYKTGDWIYEYAVRASEVPLSYTLAIPSLDLFFAPINPILLLSIPALLITFALIAVGSRISRTKTRLGADVVWYVALYSMVAPLWLIGSVSDVIMGVSRSWR